MPTEKSPNRANHSADHLSGASQVLQAIVSTKKKPEGEELMALKIEQAIQIIEVLTSGGQKVKLSSEEKAKLIEYLTDKSAYSSTLLVGFTVE